MADAMNPTCDAPAPSTTHHITSTQGTPVLTPVSSSRTLLEDVLPSHGAAMEPRASDANTSAQASSSTLPGLWSKLTNAAQRAPPAPLVHSDTPRPVSASGTACDSSQLVQTPSSCDSPGLGQAVCFAPNLNTTRAPSPSLTPVCASPGGRPPRACPTSEEILQALPRQQPGKLGQFLSRFRDHSSPRSPQGDARSGKAPAHSHDPHPMVAAYLPADHSTARPSSGDMLGEEDSQDELDLCLQDIEEILSEDSTRLLDLSLDNLDGSDERDRGSQYAWRQQHGPVVEHPTNTSSMFDRSTDSVQQDPAGEVAQANKLVLFLDRLAGWEPPSFRPLAAPAGQAAMPAEGADGMPLTATFDKDLGADPPLSVIPKPEHDGGNCGSNLGGSKDGASESTESTGSGKANTAANLATNLKQYLRRYAGTTTATGAVQGAEAPSKAEVAVRLAVDEANMATPVQLRLVLITAGGGRSSDTSSNRSSTSNRSQSSSHSRNIHANRSAMLTALTRLRAGLPAAPSRAGPKGVTNPAAAPRQSPDEHPQLHTPAVERSTKSWLACKLEAARGKAAHNPARATSLHLPDPQQLLTRRLVVDDSNLLAPTTLQLCPSLEPGHVGNGLVKTREGRILMSKSAAGTPKGTWATPGSGVAGLKSPAVLASPNSAGAIKAVAKAGFERVSLMWSRVRAPDASQLTATDGAVLRLVLEVNESAVGTGSESGAGAGTGAEVAADAHITVRICVLGQQDNSNPETPQTMSVGSVGPTRAAGAAVIDVNEKHYQLALAADNAAHSAAGVTAGKNLLMKRVMRLFVGAGDAAGLLEEPLPPVDAEEGGPVGMAGICIQLDAS